ncbi:hypothetical protein B0O99DRAFT_592316 [Bisporella sp. PMI_857]|nr:hypothetical protein B0O99DRAFT_592316 [Bisporella sp. PMI_857]
MTEDDTFAPIGILSSDQDGPPTPMQQLTTAVLEDVFYNIIHDICLETHREEKQALANSAAIEIENRARDLGLPGEEEAEVQTEGAVYRDGQVLLVKNPLQTSTELLCPKCYLPRLLHPIDGKGAQKPALSLDKYCKARPFIDKPDYDIYGQTFKENVGRGKKRVEVETKAQENNGTPPPDAPRQNIPFPHAKCNNCNKHVLIHRMVRHMNRCIGGGGRSAARSANMQIQNGSDSRAGSRNGTPVPGSGNGKTSPSKRSIDEDEDSDSPVKKKKLTKKSAVTKLKAPKMMKSSSQLSSSKLSFESKAPNSDDEDEDNDDDGDGEYGTTISVEPKKKAPTNKLVIKKKNSLNLVPKKKWKYGTALPPLPPDVVKMRSNGKANGDGDSPESSQTLSSPNE